MALFTVEEARGFHIGGETPLSDSTRFPDSTITEASARIKERFEDICGVAFEETETTVSLDGGTRTSLLLPNTRVSALAEVSVDDVAFTEDQVSEVKVYSHGEIDRVTSYWGSGRQNISVTYTHGWPEVPASIKWAALVVAVKELIDSDLTSRMTSRSDEMGTTRFAPMGTEGNWYGIPAVDSILQQYSERVPAIG